MKNYVKEMETITRKKKSFFLSFLLGILFFMVYSGIILTEHTFLRDICLISSMASILLVSSLATYAGEGRRVIKDVEGARLVIEWSGDEPSVSKVNALVSLFRSRKREMGWRKVTDILIDYDYWEDELWKDVARTGEGERYGKNSELLKGI